MSMMEPGPSDDEVAEKFAQMQADFADQFADIDASDVVSVALLDELELSKRFNEVRTELLERGEMIQPTTERGRELHSVRSAYLVEMRRRKMM